MKTIKFLVVLAMACSTLFLFNRCSSNTERSTNDTTSAQAKSAPEAGVQTSASIAANDTLCCACNDLERYSSPMAAGGGKEIAPESGKTMVESFYHGTDKKYIKGGFISKVALDAIFCNHPDFNGIYCYIAQDASGKQLMIIEGWRGVDASGSTITNVDFDDGIPAGDRYKTFQTQTLCPTMCGFCGE